MSALPNALSAALIDSLWQDAVVAVLLWVALWSLRHRTANSRYAICCAALALMALLPIANTAMLYERALPADLSLPAASGTVTIRTTATPLPAVASVVRRS